MSELSPDVAAYLAATRGSASLTAAQPQLIAAYRQTFTRLVKILGAIFLVDIEPPPLAVVYSPIAHAETLVVRGQAHLVYDQYLGQILNRLNRLFFEDAGDNEVAAYLHKIYAARSLAGGRPDRALEHAIAFGVLAHHLTPSGDQEGTLIRRLYTAWQETFVIAHELVHYIFRKYPRAAYTFQRYCLELVAIVSSQLEHKDTLAQIAAVSETLVESRSRDDGPESVEPPARLPDLFAFDMAVMGKSFGVDTFDPSTNATVLEECICDAAALLASSMIPIVDKHVVDATCAAFLGLHHLRLIRMIDAAIAESEREDKDTPVSRIVAETQYRFSFFRDIADVWNQATWSTLPTDAMRMVATFLDGGSLRISLVGVNDRYDSLTMGSDHIAVNYRELSDKLRASGDIYELIEEGEDAHDAVRRICDLPQS